MRFLVMDDSPDDRRRIQKELQSLFEDSRFRFVLGPDDFEDALAQADFDVALTDYRLHWGDGLTLLRQLKDSFPYVPVLMVTNADSEALAVQGMKIGLSDYLCKEDLSRLPRAVKEACGKARREREYDETVKKLGISEEQYRTVSEMTSDLAYAFRVEPDSTLVAEWVTDAYTRITGYAPGELGEGDWSRLIHPDDLPMALEQLQRLLAGQMDVIEFRIVTKSGEIRWLRDFSRPIWDAERSRIVRILGAAQDVTERKRTETALRETTKEYQILFDSNPLPMWVYTTDSLKILAVNQAAIKTYGYSHEEFLHMTIKDLRPPETIPALLQYLPKMQPGLNRAGIWKHRKKDGTLFDAEILVHEPPPHSIGTRLAIISDMTERLRADAALRESEERYRGLFETANDIIYTHDLSGKFTSINKAGEKISGYSRAEVLKLNIRSCVTAEYFTRMRQIAAGKAAGEVPTTFDLEIKSKDDRRIALEVSTQSVYRNGQPVGVQGIARDVTERKRLEEQLRHAQKMESVGTLAGGVAHDFNNILTGIIGFSDLMLRNLSPQHPHYGNLREIQRLGERAAQLTRQLLTFARQQMLDPKRLNLNQVIYDLSQFLQRVIGEHIELKVALTDEPTLLFADGTQIEQVLMNLCINARDAMPHGGTLLIETGSVRLDDAFCQLHPWAKPGDYIRLTVSDTGVGFDRATKERIFDPFFTTKAPGQGTGLGLSIVYAIIQQHGGMIDVYSEVGRGAAFNIYLPAAEAGEAPAERAPLRALPGGRETLLVVEDEAVVRDLIVHFMQTQGYKVLAAGNGEEALRLADAHKGLIDLVVSDAVMPKMGGRELYEVLRSRWSGLKFIFMSGYSMQALGDRFLLEEGLDFLHKPFKPMDFARKVREVLDK